MKNFCSKAMGSFMAAIPAIANVAMTVSANNVASPCLGQPKPPKTIKKYRKF